MIDKIREATLSDLGGLFGLVAAQDNFTSLERQVAEEVLEEGLSGREDYRTLVAGSGGRLVGFVCFGPIPLTESAYDLYWIATLPAMGRSGIGSALLAAMEERLADCRAVVYIDTSSTIGYTKARNFYEKNGYLIAARLKDFYHPGDDRLIYRKEL